MNLKHYLKHDIFGIISDIASDMQVESYVIGGFVRDLILERQSKDIDIVVVGSGIDLAKNIANKIGDTKVSVFKTFGTAMLKYNDLEIEFVGARTESYKRESRKPIVEDGTLQDDQNRRDFTINTLALCLNREKFGELVDPFNGLDDLKNKIIRTPLDPDITYSDDPLRMMRAIRFATQLEFKIDKKSLASIEKNKERIEIISKERIIDELNKIVQTKQPSIGFKILSKTGILEIIFPELENLKGIDVQSGKTHKDNFYHTLEVLDKIAKYSDNIWLKWAAILHDIAKPKTKKFYKKLGWTFHAHDHKGAEMVPKIFQKLKLPMNDKMKYVQKLVALHLRPIVLSEDFISDSAIRRLLFDAGDEIDDLMGLCEADITSKNMDRVKRHLKNFEIVRQKLKDIEEKDRIRNWQPPISGNVIMETFSINQCKEVGIIKKSIREAILDGEIENTYKDAFNFMLKKGKKLGLKTK